MSREVLFVGDSFQAGDGSSTKTFYGLLKDWESSMQFTINRNSDVTCAGGYGFTGGSSGSNQFINLLNNINTSVYGSVANVTDVVVCGGYNDYSNYSAVSAAVSAFKTEALSRMPNAKLWLYPMT